MLKKRFLIYFVALVWLILIFNLAANYYFLYTRFWWTDVVMHFLGGYWVALLGYYIFYLFDFSINSKTKILGRKIKKILDKNSFLIITLCFVLGVGIFWEIIEFILRVPYDSDYIFDTVSDLIIDMIGGGVAYFLVLKKIYFLRD